MNPRYRYGMNWIRQAKRLALYMRDHFACLYCGAGIEDEGTILTLDHVQHTGSNDASNLVTACFSCNSAKQHWSLNRWLRRLPKPERVKARIERALATSITTLLPKAKATIAARSLVREEPF